MLAHFHVAAFAFDGELVGVGERRIDLLSRKWIDFCDSMLAARGATFEGDFGGPLSHISVRYSAAEGSGLVTILVNDITVSSWVLLAGLNSESDDEVLRMFVASLRDVEQVRAATPNQEPFEKLFGIEGRPLAGLVVWSASRISDEDNELVRELSQHLIAAHFLRSWNLRSGQA